MAQTPLGRYTYSDTILQQGWHRDPGPEDIWAKQEIEITKSVPQYADLPTPDPAVQTGDGQRRVYYVRSLQTAYRDTGSNWVPVWGLGSNGDPIPGRAFREAITVVNGMTVGGTATFSGPATFDETVSLNNGYRSDNYVHNNIASISANEDRTDLRFEWVPQTSMVLDVHAQISTSAVGTRNYVHKRFYLATYQTAGEIFAQESYVPDAMNAGTANYDVIGDFEQATDGSTDLILPIYHSHNRHVTFNLEFLGNKPVFMDGVSVHSGLPRGEMPAQQNPETAPGLPFEINGDLNVDGTARVGGNEVWHSGNLTPAGAGDLQAHEDDTSNPHNVTAAQINAVLQADYDTFASTVNSHLSSSSNPHSVTLDQARVAGSTLSGSVTINGTVTAAVHSTGAFEIEDDATGNLTINDAATDTDHIRQRPNEPTEFIQGADIGPIEAPENTLTQIINSSSTAEATAGEEVGYTFSLNSQTSVAVKGEADGSGGITGVSFEFHSENGQVAEIDNTGNLKIAGSIEEGATFT